jgi:ABC-type transport system substrate-binding protein
METAVVVMMVMVMVMVVPAILVLSLLKFNAISKSTAHYSTPAGTGPWRSKTKDDDTTIVVIGRCPSILRGDEAWGGGTADPMEGMRWIL